MKATGTWVALVDPREKKKESSIIKLSKEVKSQLEEDQIEEIKTNILEVHSAGEKVLDSRIKSGKMVIVDPRMPFAVVHDKDEVAYLVVQENQIMMVE